MVLARMLVVQVSCTKLGMREANSMHRKSIDGRFDITAIDFEKSENDTRIKRVELDVDRRVECRVGKTDWFSTISSLMKKFVSQSGESALFVLDECPGWD
jgi:hypothetical protein